MFPCLVSRSNRKPDPIVVSRSFGKADTLDPVYIFMTHSQFLDFARRYAFNVYRKLGGVLNLRKTEYKEVIDVTYIHHDKKTGEVSEKVARRVVKRLTEFDLNLIDDATQDAWVLWQHKKFHPRAAVWYGVQSLITATRRFKVANNADKVLDKAPSVKKYSDRMTLTSDDTGEVAFADLSIDQPNMVKLAFMDTKQRVLAPLEPGKKAPKPIGKGKKSGRQLSPVTIAQHHRKLAVKAKEWLADAPTPEEQAYLLNGSGNHMGVGFNGTEIRKAIKKDIAERQAARFAAYEKAVANLVYGPPCYDDYYLIFLRNEARREYAKKAKRLANGTWAHRDFGFTGCEIIRNRNGILPGYSADALRELRIGKPRITIPDHEIVMTGDGMGL